MSDIISSDLETAISINDHNQAESIDFDKFTLPINNLLISSPNRDSVTHPIPDSLDNDMQAELVDKLLIKELLKFFKQAKENANAFNGIKRNADGKYTTNRDFYGYQELYMPTENSVFTDEKLKTKQEETAGLVEVIQNIEHQFYIIDLVAYKQAIDKIAQAIISDLETGKNVAIYVNANAGLADLNSHSYVSYLVYQKILGLLQQMGKSELANRLKVTNVPGNYQSIFVLDDFVISGRKIAELYDSAKERMGDNDIKVMTIASKGVQNVSQTNVIVNSVYTFPSGAFFTSTTSDCDYTVSGNTDIQNMVDSVESIPELYVRHLNRSNNDTIIDNIPLVKNAPAIPKVMRIDKAQIKPYRTNKVVIQRLRQFYSTRLRDYSAQN